MRTVTLQSLLLRAWQRVGNDASTIDGVPSGARTMLVAADPAPRSDWPAAPYTFEETVAEAVASIAP